jgi:hypothetical protein
MNHHEFAMTASSASGQKPYEGRALPNGRIDHYSYKPPIPGNLTGGLALIGISALTGFLAEIVLSPLVGYAASTRLDHYTAITYDSADRVSVIGPDLKDRPPLPRNPP